MYTFLANQQSTAFAISRRGKTDFRNQVKTCSRINSWANMRAHRFAYARTDRKFFQDPECRFHSKKVLVLETKRQLKKSKFQTLRAAELSYLLYCSVEGESVIGKALNYEVGCRETPHKILQRGFFFFFLFKERNHVQTKRENHWKIGSFLFFPEQNQWKYRINKIVYFPFYGKRLSLGPFG